MKTIQTVGVIGTDELACGIVHACVAAGFTVTQVGSDNAALARARTDLAARLAAGGLTASKRIAWSTQVADFHGDDFIIVADAASVTAQHLRETENALGTYAIIACAADASGIARLAGALVRPDKLLGMRISEPMSATAPVELTRGPQTSAATRSLVEAFVTALGRPFNTR